MYETYKGWLALQRLTSVEPQVNFISLYYSYRPLHVYWKKNYTVQVLDFGNKKEVFLVVSYFIN